MNPSPKGGALTPDPIPNRGGDNNRGTNPKQPVRTEVPSVKEGDGQTHKTDVPYNLGK